MEIYSPTTLRAATDTQGFLPWWRVSLAACLLEAWEGTLPARRLPSYSCSRAGAPHTRGLAGLLRQDMALKKNLPFLPYPASQSNTRKCRPGKKIRLKTRQSYLSQGKGWNLA